MGRYTLRLKNGKQSMAVRVNFDAAAHVEEFYKRMADAIKAEQAMKEQKTAAAADAYGETLMALYRLILGRETAAAVEAYFGGAVLAMVTQMNTFIRDRIQQDVDRASAAARRAKLHAFLRDQRRARRA